MKSSRFDAMVEIFSGEVLDYLKEHKDFADTETAMCREINAVLCRSIEVAFSRFDELLYESRADHLVSKGFVSRTMLSASGSLVLRRRRYFNKRTGTSLNLADVVLDIPASDKITPRAAELVCHRALDAAYQGAADLLENLSGAKISKTTVKEALAQAADVLKRRDSIHTFEGERVSETLYCEPDGCFIKLQQRHVPKARRKTKNKELSVIVLYEGKERSKAGALKRKNTHYIATADSFEKAWASTDRYIDKTYDTSAIKQSYLGSDGDAGCLSGVDILPGFVTVGYDVWHLYDKVRRLAKLAHAKEISGLLSRGQIEEAANCARHYSYLAQDETSRGDLVELADFISTNKKIIANGLKHNLGTIEGTNAHLIGSRLKNYGGAWSIAGADAMVTLRANHASGGQIPTVRSSAFPKPCKTSDEDMTETDSSSYRSMYKNTVEYYHQAKIAWENESCRIKKNMAQVY